MLQCFIVVLAASATTGRHSA